MGTEGNSDRVSQRARAKACSMHVVQIAELDNGVAYYDKRNLTAFEIT
jgi:hypothetical protein